jgi:hypothetical protein
VTTHRQRDALDDDFVNLKFKSAQYFKCAHKGRVWVSARMRMSICVSTVFLKKKFKISF